jgi:hypothetical protein
MTDTELGHIGSADHTGTTDPLDTAGCIETGSGHRNGTTLTWSI